MLVLSNRRIIEAINYMLVLEILYNHESPRRNQNFVSRKITKNLALIVKGKINKIKLKYHFKETGELFKRLCLLNVENDATKKSQDFVIGKNIFLKDFINLANYVGLDYPKTI